MNVPAIEAKGVVKSYGPHPVLRGIDMVVERGQILGYIGPNGAGKTTTVKILTGMLASFEGEVRVAGFDLRTQADEVKRRIGYVPENARLYEALTAQEFLQLVGRLHDLNETEIQRRSAGLAEALGVTEVIDARVSSLSKGQRQKVLIASALIHDPEILFLDEPLAGLDVDATILFKELLRALAGRGKTIFYCSHLMDVVERVCDRIAILHEGRIVANGSFEEICATAPGRSLESVFAELTQSPQQHDRIDRILQSLGGA